VTTLQVGLDLDLTTEPQNTTTFAGNLSLPVHRWFRYSAGYSAEWVESIIGGDRSARVLDPFVGSGTTVLAAQARGVPAIGLESQPFVYRVARAKLAWQTDVRQFFHRAEELMKAHAPAVVVAPPPLVQKCFTSGVLEDLFGLRDQILELDLDEPQNQLLWLAFVSVVRKTSHAGTAQWQYVLPNKTKSMVQGVLVAFRSQVAIMIADMEACQAKQSTPPNASIIQADARQDSVLPEGWATHVICSPPYANNYDYADATRLEQTVLGEISSWADLKQMRSVLVRSCSQAMTRYDTTPVFADPILAPILDELTTVHSMLAEAKVGHGGKKAYDDMVVAYFHDLARVWRQLRSATCRGAKVCFVVGDSAPYGVYVPVERWLGELAIASGFKSWRFEKLRDRNVKWKNRKHTVPLHEGRLWVEG